MLKKKVSEQDKELAKQKAAEAKLKAEEAAEAGKKEGKKKIGYLSRGIKSKYLEKSGDVNLPAEEARRRSEYVQPLLDGLKVSKNHYNAVTKAAEAALANAKAAAAASTDFALAVCNTEYLKTSAAAPALPSFQEAHHELQKIATTFINTIQETILDVAQEGTAKVDDARKLKEEYYEQRMSYDMGLKKLQSCKAALDKAVQADLPAEKKQKAQDSLSAAQTNFLEAEQAYREAERKMVQSIAGVVAAKASHDVDFLAILVEAQATRARKSQAVMERIQPELESIEVPPPLPVPSVTEAPAPFSPGQAPGVADDEMAAPVQTTTADPEPDEAAASNFDADMMAI